MSKAPKRQTGQPRDPYRTPQEWECRPMHMIVSKCGKVKATITPMPEGDAHLVLDCGTWTGLDDAKEVARLLLRPLVDEHGFARDFNEYEWEAFEEIASAPTVVSIDDTLPYITEEELANANKISVDEEGEEEATASTPETPSTPKPSKGRGAKAKKTKTK